MRSLLIALVLVSGTSACGEQPEPSGLPLTVGSHVRLRSGAVSESLRGIVAVMDEHALTLATDHGALRVPLDAITTAEMRVGRRSHARQGLAIGGALGLLAGTQFPVDPRTCNDRNSNSFCSRGAAVTGGAVSYALLGAGVGAVIKTDR